MKSHGKDCSGKDRNTPLCLSRAKWKCSGKASRRDEIQRLDKKCGKSVFQTTGSALNKQSSQQQPLLNNPTAVVGAVYLGAAGAALGTGLLAAKNVRIRGKLKFGGNDRITPFKV